MGSLVAQMVKSLPAMQQIWVRSLGWEDPLEKEMAIHSRILAWKIPWTKEPNGLQSMGLQRVEHDRVTSLSKVMKTDSLCIKHNITIKSSLIYLKKPKTL